MRFRSVGSALHSVLLACREGFESPVEERIKPACKKAVSTCSLEHSVVTAPLPEEKSAEPVKVDPLVQTPAKCIYFIAIGNIRKYRND